MGKYHPLAPEIREMTAEDVRRQQRRTQERTRITQVGTPDEMQALKYANRGYGWEDIVRYTGIPPTQARMLVLGVVA